MRGGTKNVADRHASAEKYVRKAYYKARRIAKEYHKRHSNTHLDADDFTQEAMIAFLEGRTMGFGLIDAYRKAAPLKRTQVGKIPSPIFWQVFDVTLIDEDAEDNLNRAVLTRQLREAIAQMEPIKQDVIGRYFLQEETYEQIGNVYDKSRTWASNLIKATIRELRREMS